jgi:dethiobiotin synthetase
MISALMSEMKRTLFITGTDTGVGKTVLTALLTRFLCEQSVKVAALKPVCSGGRGDARALCAALDGALTLDEINPWHFQAPIAPVLAARRENQRVMLSQVLAHARAVQTRFEVVLVEGAGGLLSPLGEDFNSRDLIEVLRATPVIVAQNKLGAVNQVLLTLAALPKSSRAKARVILFAPPKADASTKSNVELLAEFCAAERIFPLPWLGADFSLATVLKKARVRRVLAAFFS